jgi:hypothetical protein
MRIYLLSYMHILQRSEELPYTHPMKIRNFATTRFQGSFFVITGGGEGAIRIWRYDDGTFSLSAVVVVQ